MYRQLINKRKEQLESARCLQERRKASNNTQTSNNQYETANRELKSHFIDLKQMMTFEDPTYQFSSDRRRSKRGIVASAAMLQQSAAEMMQTTTIGSSGFEKRKSMVTESYRLNQDVSQSGVSIIDQKMRQSSQKNESIGFQKHKTIIGMRIEQKPDISVANTNLSQNQISKIERTSKKQLDSISKLQTQLTRTQHMMSSSGRNSAKVTKLDEKMDSDLIYHDTLPQAISTAMTGTNFNNERQITQREEQIGLFSKTSIKQHKNDLPFGSQPLGLHKQTKSTVNKRYACPQGNQIQNDQFQSYVTVRKLQNKAIMTQLTKSTMNKFGNSELEPEIRSKKSKSVFHQHLKSKQIGNKGSDLHPWQVLQGSFSDKKHGNLSQKGKGNIKQNKFAQVINQLELDDHIREKAQNYFAQSKLEKYSDYSKFSSNKKQRSGVYSVREKMKKDSNKYKKDQILAQAKDEVRQIVSQDSELLKNTYNERQIASQGEIKRQLDQIMINSGNKKCSKKNQKKKKQIKYATVGKIEKDSDSESINSSEDNQTADDLSYRDSKIGEKSVCSDQRNNEAPEIQQSEVASRPNSNQQNKDPLGWLFGSPPPTLKRQIKDSRKVVFEDDDNERSSILSTNLLQAITPQPDLYQNLPPQPLVKMLTKEELEIEKEHDRLLEISREFRQKRKDQMAKTVFKPRDVENLSKLESFQKDYSIKILGEYRFGLHQKAPISTDPNAPAAHQFSQLACYRFADTNKRFMELYEQNMLEMRKSRRFLADEINNSPEGKHCAREILNKSLAMQKMQQCVQFKLIDGTIKEQIKSKQNEQLLINQQLQLQQQQKKRVQGNLLDLQRHKQRNSTSQLEEILSSRESSEISNQSATPNQYTSQLNQLQKQEFEKILRLSTQAGDLDDRIKKKLEHSVKSLFNGEQILDVHSDFVDRAGMEHTRRMKKLTYEMDQLITDHYYGTEQSKMGLSLCYNQQEAEQSRFIRSQQKTLLSYLNVLFGGDKSSKAFQDMSKNLINKMTHLKTQDSQTMANAKEMYEQQASGLDIDKENVNTEIVTLIAEEILKKTSFFKMFKKDARSFDNYYSKTGLTAKDAAKALMNSPDRKQQHIPGTTSPQDARKNIFQKYSAEKIANTEADKDEDVCIEKAKASFIQQCEKNLVVALPILLRVKDKQIFLQRYQLNHGLCQALSIALTNFPDIATDFYFESNNLADADLSVLLLGINELTTVRSITYKSNMFGKQSLDALLPIIQREQTQYALRNLHLVHCKITAKVTEELLNSLNQQKNRIRCLSLVNVNLNQSNYQALCELIKVSRSLIELDISWNGMRCHQMYEVIDVIVENRSLQFLNLSYNNLHDPLQALFAESTPEAVAKTLKVQKDLERKMRQAKTTTAKTAIEYELMDSSMKHIFKICKFIKMNSKLMHLNLSGMGMTQPMMNEFGRALRRTKSMIALHLSQNNGDNESLRAALIERAHIKPFEPIVRPDLRSLNIKESLKDKDKKEFRLENSIVIGQIDAKKNLDHQDRARISEQVNLKNMLKNKRGMNDRQQVESDTSAMLIFQRYLGHKVEMPGSGQWRMIATSNDEQERCWVCNQEVYSLVFWSRQFGFKTQQQLEKLGLDELACENVLYDLENQNQEHGIEVDYYTDKGNPQLFESAHKIAGYPLLYGDFNNWKPQRMYTMEEFCYILDTKKPDFISQLKTLNYMSEMVQTTEDMNPKELLMYKDRVRGLLEKYSRINNWRKLLGKSLRYKSPFLANAEVLLMKNNKLNISKMDEELYPSDSASDFGGGSNSDSGSSGDDRNEPNQMGTKSGTRTVKRMNRQLYVMPCFLKPGKQTFIVQSLCAPKESGPEIKGKKGRKKSFLEDTTTSGGLSNMMRSKFSNSQKPKKLSDSLDPQYFFHNVNVPARIERVPLFVKQLRAKASDESKFDKDMTVFKDWKQPTDKDFKKMVDHDIEKWNIPRFIKDESKLKAVYKLYYKHIRNLFNIQITVSAESNFPSITWLDFSKFAEKCQVVDKNVQQKDVDRFFVASAGKTQLLTYRYQFLELLMRVAENKFYHPGETSTHAKALSKFLEENCLENGPTTEWQKWREEVWWTWENHRILNANLAGIKKIYNSFFAPRKKFMTKADCIDLMVKTTQLIPDENKVIYCYGMSKMAVVIDSGEQRAKFDELKFVEFLEFFGRCANCKYKEVADMTMEDRLIAFMDDLFPLYSLTRKEVEDEEEELSESDPDY